MTEHKINTNVNRSAEPSWLRYAQPAAMITVATGAVYYVGWAYADSYFRRFGIQHDSLGFPVHYYLTKSFWAVMLALMVLPFMFYNAKNSNRTRLSAFRGNTIPFLMSASAISYSTQELPNLDGWLSLALGVLLATALIHQSLGRHSLAYDMMSASFVLRISGCVVVIFFAVSASSWSGRMHAENTIEGRTDRTISIQLTTDSPLAEGIEGKVLILVLHQNGTYYLVEKARPAPKRPTMYVIPDSQVHFATTHQLD